MLLVESEHYSHAYFFQLVHILVNASRFDVDIQKSLYKDHPRMHVHHQHFWYVKVSDRAENFKNWNQNERSGLVIVLEQFRRKRQQGEHNSVWNILQGQFFVDFLHEGWYYCLQGLNRSVKLVEIPTVLNDIGNFRNDVLPIMRKLVLGQYINDLSQSWCDWFLVAITNERYFKKHLPCRTEDLTA